VPRYGEYANPGYTPPAYTAQPVAPAQPAPYDVQPGAPRPRRIWDIVLSSVLLFIGLFGVLLAVFNAATIDFQLEELYSEYGASGQYEPGAGSAIAQAVIIVSHVLLYAVAILVTVLLIRKNKVSFWVPLTIGAIAFIVFMVTLLVLVLSDPVLLDAAMQQQ
jgi:phosphoglycerol transferase MdoB-like AlkP superfamily enzyme